MVANDWRCAGPRHHMPWERRDCFLYRARGSRAPCSVCRAVPRSTNAHFNTGQLFSSHYRITHSGCSPHISAVRAYNQPIISYCGLPGNLAIRHAHSLRRRLNYRITVRSSFVQPALASYYSHAGPHITGLPKVLPPKKRLAL
ncbi:hypothetical protein J6590_057941 [Homalodisca vitripennis]|nr:hypothetical protein J6590_057941 [Homalodisca vitripennis]